MKCHYKPEIVCPVPSNEACGSQHCPLTLKEIRGLKWKMKCAMCGKTLAANKVFPTRWSICKECANKEGWNEKWVLIMDNVMAVNI